MAIVDLRDLCAEGDLSPLRYLTLTIVGSVQTLADVHAILSGAKEAAESNHDAFPDREGALHVALMRLLREAIETDPLVEARLRGMRGEAPDAATSQTPPADVTPPATPAQESTASAPADVTPPAAPSNAAPQRQRAKGAQ